MNNIEASISQVERLFEKVTGQAVPQSTQAYAPLHATQPEVQVQKNMELK